jgi:hypothetical protein
VEYPNKSSVSGLTTPATGVIRRHSVRSLCLPPQGATRSAGLSTNRSRIYHELSSKREYLTPHERVLTVSGAISETSKMFISFHTRVACRRLSGGRSTAGSI